MTLKLGDLAPNCKLKTTDGNFDFYEWMEDAWAILFSHPKDFTPVCTTELGMVARMKDEFLKRRTKVMALSVDSLEDHKKWVKDIEETQDVKLNFPIIADEDMSVAKKYDMIHPNESETFTVRSVFIVDNNKKIRAILTYPASAGRNFEEILRLLDSLQLTDNFKVATPANWKMGDDCVVVPSLSTEEAREVFPDGVREVKPYLRVTPCPKK